MSALNAHPSLEDHGRDLEQAGWSWRHLAERLPALLANCGELHRTRRSFWINGLRRSWQAQGWAMRGESGRELLALAAAWCDHPLSLAVGEALDQRGELDALAALDLITSRHVLGETAAALQLAWRWQVLAPGELRFAEIHQELSDWSAWRSGLPRLEAAGLRLEPLGFQHLRDFAWQYHDPDIVALCRLPDFKTDGQWQAWLDGLYRLGDELPLAILHRDMGFVGMVHLVRAGDLGFVYYWLGQNFRGQGLATGALRLALSGLASSPRNGLRACYAKVYDYNAPSRRLLERAGFVDVGIQALPPDEEERFYRWGEAAPRRQVVADLHALMRGMGSATRVGAILEGRRV